MAHVARPSRVIPFIYVICAVGAAGLRADDVLDEKMHHLRSGPDREWSEFPERAEADKLVVHFQSRANAAEKTLRLRHRDLKQVWKLSLNGKDLGTLPQDENPMLTYWAVPAAALRDGANELAVACAGGESDDVTVGDVALIDRRRREVLSESALEVTVTDKETGKPLPCRLTIVDRQGFLVGLGTESDLKLAVRPGVVYAAEGQVSVKLPAGKYTVYAGRGFEYGIDSAEVELRPGAAAEAKLAIRHEVPTPGYVACDTHIHTWTYSRHGDATLAERVVTLAGEGVELPIATDHNLTVDFDPPARAAGVRQFFTPVVGNEVTTAAAGHFNVFPVPAGGKLINWRVRDWEGVGRSIAEVVKDEPVVILNHARDVHGGFRPFDPKRHLAVTGEDLDGWKNPACAMEVVNSGAVMNDPMRLVQDWMGLLNRGVILTPIGASDSHDVSRYIVGQGRTYVRCDDGDPGKIDIGAACRGLREGRVLVSYGLLADIAVATPEGRYGPGETAAAKDDVSVELRVLGPAWTRASRVALYANGLMVRQEEIATPAGQPERAGIKWQAKWTLAKPKHDVVLVAVATGPGVSQPFWPTARPYQPTSPEFTSYVLGVTGAVRLDADASGRFEPAAEYASKLVEESGGDASRVLTALSGYDEAVGAQAAAALRGRLGEKFESALGPLLNREDQNTPVLRVWRRYLEAWRQSGAAQAASSTTTRPAR